MTTNCATLRSMGDRGGYQMLPTGSVIRKEAGAGVTAAGLGE